MTDCKRFATIQLAAYTEAEWSTANPVLELGQPAFSTDALYDGTNQMKFKVGNGTDAWDDLDYMTLGGEPVDFIIIRSTGNGHRIKFTADDTCMLSQPGEDLDA